MTKKFIVANWKENKTVSEALEWLEVISNFKFQISNSQDKMAIVCPPFTALSAMKNVIDEKQLPIHLGVQNVSPFPLGAYTGEIAATQVKELATHVIIGHSERRKNFGESDEMLAQKVSLAKEAGLTIIFCVQGKDTAIPEGVDIVAYEPVFAIGSGTPDTPENANEVASYLKAEKHAPVVLYGGSVKPENIASFTAQSAIDGALVGGASLDATTYLSLIANA